MLNLAVLKKSKNNSRIRRDYKCKRKRYAVIYNNLLYHNCSYDQKNLYRTGQESLTEGEDSVQLTSLNYLVWISSF